jgi:hypothetical protein
LLPTRCISLFAMPGQKPAGMEEISMFDKWNAALQVVILPMCTADLYCQLYR